MLSQKQHRRHRVSGGDHRLGRRDAERKHAVRYSARMGHRDEAAVGEMTAIRDAAKQRRARNIGRAGDDANRERESFGGLLHAPLCTTLSRAGVARSSGGLRGIAQEHPDERDRES
ncbi:MAG TPA: hypothetical protein VGD80_34275, partial [Kofleriaceae bacterium]